MPRSMRWPSSGPPRCSAVIIQPDINKSVAAALRLAQSLPKQVRYAASVAINTALQQGLQAERARMQQVFDRPTPYVVGRGVSLTPSTKDKLVGQLAVDTQPAGSNVPAGKPLLAEVQGGARRAKRSELLLQRAGILPAGWLTTPGKAARMDGYGNLARGQILEILSWFQAYPATNRREGRVRSSARDNISAAGKQRRRKATRTHAGREYFAVQPGAKRGGLRPGIYVRQLGGSRFVGPAARPRLVLVFVPRAQYQQRLDFAQQAERAIAAALPGAFTAALRRALETAR